MSRLSFSFIIVTLILTLASCNKEPDESNLYTFTGQTIQDYLQANDSAFHKFNIILRRSGLDRMMASYGEYTCYAPLDRGVDQYIDSLWNDPDAKIPHNGLTENSIDGLTDEQCQEIAKYHLSAMQYTFVEDLSDAGGKEITTMLSTPFISRLHDDGVVRFNNSVSVLRSVEDGKLTNGNVHIVDKVIPRTTHYLAEILEEHTEFSIFHEALVKCGLTDLLHTDHKTNADGIPRTYKCDNINGPAGGGWEKERYYYPTECKIKFTVFAETNETLAAAGINSFEDLRQKCAEWYGGAAEWYDYPDKEANPISTGDDYTNTFNVVNMFLRYHILKASMPVSKLVYENNTSNEPHWNMAFGGEPHDYYETLLPHTIMKIWQPLYQNTGASRNIWINRWREHNTLTDEVGTFGSDATHQIRRTGCLVIRAESNIQAYNGYIHVINSPLIYDADVPRGVLHERMRIDMGTILHELSNNNIRFATSDEIGAMNTVVPGSGLMTRLPLDYFDNLVSYNGRTQLAWYTWGNWRAWESDQMTGWDENDFAFRLPPVPTGDYEIRIFFAPLSYGGLQQYYIGTSSDPSSMQPLGLPIDARYPNVGMEEHRNATGYLLISEFNDYGVASDLVLRNHGYMRGPASFSRGTYNKVRQRVYSPDELVADKSCCSRYEEGYGVMVMRKILGTRHIEQSREYWLRIKNLLKGYDGLLFYIDAIELVPIDIVNSQDYTEDWY